MDAPEPLVRSTNETGEVILDVLNVIQLGREGVVDVHDNDLPVSLALIEQSHDTEDLDLLDLTDVADLFTDLANVQGIVVALSFRLGMGLVRVLPGLRCITRGEFFVVTRRKRQTHLREGTIVPDVTVVGEAVANEA